MKWTKAIVAGACVFAAVGTACGTVLYSENFQSYLSGAINFIGSGNGWTGTGMGVGQTNSIGGVGSFFTSADARRSLFVNDSSDTVPGSQTLIYTSLNPGATSISNNGNITFSFDFNVRTNDSQVPTFDLRANGGASGNGWCFSLNFMSNDGKFRRYTSSASWEDLSSFVISTANWYHVEIKVGDLSTANDTCCVKVWEATPAGGYGQAGTLVVDAPDVGFRADVSFIDGFDFRTLSPTASPKSIYYNIDNIQVGTPPAISLYMITN